MFLGVFLDGLTASDFINIDDDVRVVYDRTNHEIVADILGAEGSEPASGESLRC